jgi:regulator of cell morphogenesis and NO signaling
VIVVSFVGNVIFPPETMGLAWHIDTVYLSTERSLIMTQVDLNSSVGQWVAAHPQTSRVFEALQIEYCCGGGKSLEQACWDRGLNPQQVVQQLEQVVLEDTQATENWLHASLTTLCDHIEQTHHAYLKDELPRVTEMIGQVVEAHGENHPELTTVKEVFASLRSELEPHMLKEEQVLFPAIRQLETSAGEPSFPFGSVANPIRMMEQEHDSAGHALSRIHVLTRDYQVPDDACNTYRALLGRLRHLESDMHQHVHKENSILFPRALELERTQVPS